MLWLGLWQMHVFEEQGNRSAAARAAQPPVQLLDFVSSDGIVGDVYGKQVLVTGRYLDEHALPVVAADGSVRVLDALQLPDGRVVPIVRGALGRVGDDIPPAPSGEVTQTGIFLPPEPAADHDVPVGALPSVRLQVVAQEWPQQLLPGFVTLSGTDAAAQGLAAARVSLPSGEGSWRNSGYALQWWVFAAFALAMTWRMVRTIGRRGALGSIAAEEDHR